MIPESQLRDLQELADAGDRVWVAPETFAQLVLAARVANVVALVEREGPCACHSGLSRKELEDALRHYTAGTPEGVKL